MLTASIAYATVSMNNRITLTVDVSADPAPSATWQLDGKGIPGMATPLLR